MFLLVCSSSVCSREETVQHNTTETIQPKWCKKQYRALRFECVQNARTLRACSFLSVSPWLRCNSGVFAEDTGTRCPAGEGDEAQLGIIKPSTVSVKGPGSRAGLMHPRQSSLDWGLSAVQSPLTVFSDQRKGSLTASQQWKYVFINSQRHSLTVVISLNKQYFVVPLIRAIPLSSVDCSDRQYQIIGRSSNQTKVNYKRPGQLHQF